MGKRKCWAKKRGGGGEGLKPNWGKNEETDLRGGPGMLLLLVLLLLLMEEKSVVRRLKNERMGMGRVQELLKLTN